MGLRGEAAIVGFAEFKHERKYEGPRLFTIEQWSELTAMALDDAGLRLADVNGIACTDIRESGMFTPATIVEYMGQPVNFAERIDLGGASSVGMVWRAAAAIELGIADVVVCATPALPIPSNPEPRSIDPRRFFQSSSNEWGSPQAEFEIPYGNLAQNCGYAMIAQRYGAQYGYIEEAMAKLVVDQRQNGALNPLAAFYGKPTTVEEVLTSKMIADPLRMLEIVMPVAGGGAVVVASREVAERCRHRPAWIAGFGEHLTIKTPTYAKDMCATPVGPASKQAFTMAGVGIQDIDAAQIYDCYTITVLMTLEDAGFCAKGEGQRFIMDSDLTHDGSFPLNTHGGQLGMGQAGAAGGMTQVVEAARQIMGRAEARQISTCDNVYVSGTGGIMSEQAALILQGN
ncbi:MAG: thiolase family protein [Pseudomonadota bacterium]|uniref:Thiolase C-terminal domain-containing protein n=1 Tax=marine metagenome TaxID=408172 RepID=A0A381NS28_9ZZZZ|nr:thiolase family protein [Pseudomonadota bacterium]HCP49347.1 transporter [Gammaproteobacteria bacterium]